MKARERERDKVSENEGGMVPNKERQRQSCSRAGMRKPERQMMTERERER